MPSKWLNPITWSSDKYILLQGDASNEECRKLIRGEGLILPDSYEWDRIITRTWVKWSDEWQCAVEYARPNEEGAFMRTVIRLKKRV